MEKKFINLLEDRGAPPTFWEKLYDWITNAARIVIIVTQLFIIGAFGWRFWLDRELNNLEDGIEEKGGALKNLAEQEQEIRIIQNRLNAYNEVWTGSSNHTPVIKEAFRHIPNNINDFSFSLRQDQTSRVLSIGGEISREKIDKLENSLKDSQPYFKDVTLSDIERTDGNLYSFTISAEIIYESKRSALSNYYEGTES